jgi:hypothetical protein
MIDEAALVLEALGDAAVPAVRVAHLAVSDLPGSGIRPSCRMSQ